MEDVPVDFARAAMRALRASAAACTFCGSEDIRPSRRVYGPLSRSLGLRPWRCRECGRRFPLRARVTKVRGWTPPGEEHALPEASPPPRAASHSAEHARRRRRAMLVRAGYAALLVLLVVAAVLAWRPPGGRGAAIKKWKPPAGARPWRP